MHGGPKKLAISRLLGTMFANKAKGEPEGGDHISAMIRAYAEIVRGSAYPEQTGEEISSIQGHFDSWFTKAVGISPTRARDFLWAIIRHEEKAINQIMPNVRAEARAARDSWRVIRRKPLSQQGGEDIMTLQSFKTDKDAGTFAGLVTLTRLAPYALPVSMTDLTDLTCLPTTEEWESLITLIGMTKENRSQSVLPPVICRAGISRCRTSGGCWLCTLRRGRCSRG